VKSNSALDKTPFDVDNYLNSYPADQIKEGKVVPHPNEYSDMNFGLTEVLKYFLIFYFFLFFPLIGLH